MGLLRDGGSFRDPAGQVFVSGNRVFRSVAPIGRHHYEAVRDRGTIDKSIADGFLVGSRELSRADWPTELGSASYVIEHDRVPFVSHPYEWSFGQLKLAALHHLDFQLMLLANDAVLTDATAYNIQFVGAKPVFIDLLSIAPYRDGQFWTAHRQFCEQFLNPLLLTAIKGVHYNSWYRGSLEGISTADLNGLLSFTDQLSWNMLTQVVLQARLEKTALDNPAGAIARVRKQRRFSRSAYLGFLGQLRRWISRLAPASDRTTSWQDYAGNNTYETEEAAMKRDTIEAFAAKTCPGLLIDLGCNSGDYSAAALRGGAGYVVGFDFDHKALELALQRAARDSLPLLPLWLDASNPSPDQGWLQLERAGFARRAKADAVIALAFEHHLAIAKNIPLDQAIGWIVDIARTGIIEFVPKTDETIVRMLALRDDIFPDYTEENFQQVLASRAMIVDRRIISRSGRVLYEFESD